MSKKEKLLRKFMDARGPFPWSDLVSVLTGLGFEQYEGSGSRVCFSNGEVDIRLHKPHPQNEVKLYAVRQVQDLLIAEGIVS